MSKSILGSCLSDMMLCYLKLADFILLQFFKPEDNE